VYFALAMWFVVLFYFMIKPFDTIMLKGELAKAIEKQKLAL
jgi:hypothetical protein